MLPMLASLLQRTSPSGGRFSTGWQAKMLLLDKVWEVAGGAYSAIRR
jgi:hypothetical protein